MELRNQNKCKDELPENTIKKIKDILFKLGLTPVESDWKNSAKGFYSLSLSIKNTNISVNGKGTTDTYALASAYGELMERLQNQSFFRLSYDLSPSAYDNQSFYYAPDEKNITIKDVLKSQDDWFKCEMRKIPKDIDKYDLLKKWRKISFEKVPSDFIAIPYMNLATRRLSYIPIKMASKMYMSNGMCAGNSMEEALVQGLSEIFERKVNIDIIENKIVPPTVPREYIKKFKEIYRMIEEIELNSNYKVVVKDCSLGKNYPVVGIILINKKEQTYFIKFGSHPIVELALERTLTELLQGQDIRSMSGIKEFSYKGYNEKDKKNLLGILVNGCGCYPNEFFLDKFSYEFKPFMDFSKSSNGDLLIYMLNLLNKEGYDVFIRDVSYLGFPSFHIIVPGFSEIENIYDEKSLDEYSKFIKIKKIMRNINNVSDKTINDILDYIDKQNIGGMNSVSQFIGLETKGMLPWYYTNVDLYKTALYIKVGNFSKAYNELDGFLKNIMVSAENKKIVKYYKCVRDYLGTRIDDLSEEEGMNILEKFYSNKMIKKVKYQFENNKDIFNHFGQMNCWNCDKCDIKEKCTYKEVETVYKVLKQQCSVNRINQLDIKNNIKIKNNKYN
ncbi:MAG: YcaO-like family protein [Clostridiaceae bacterium]